MKNKSLLLLITIAAISLLVSCNLDSTDGIGTLVRNDQYEESFRTSRIIGVLEGGDGYYVSTDKGIREYSYTYDNESNSYKYAFKELSDINIDNPKGVVVMDKDSIIYEKSEGGFAIYDRENLTEVTLNMDYTHTIKFTSLIDSYTTDGKYFTFIFKGNDNNYYPATFDTSPSGATVASTVFNIPPLSIVNEEYRNNISIIGKNAIKYSTTRGNSTGSADYYYIMDITSPTINQLKDSTYQKKYLIGGTTINGTSDRVVVDLNGRVYVDDEYKTQSVSNAIITKLPIVSDATRTLFIYSGRVIYTDNATSTTFNSKSSSNLSSTMIPIMIKKHNTDNNLYLVFTELSGAYVYDFANNTMTSLGKKNTGYKISDFQ